MPAHPTSMSTITAYPLDSLSHAHLPHSHRTSLSLSTTSTSHPALAPSVYNSPPSPSSPLSSLTSPSPSPFPPPSSSSSSPLPLSPSRLRRLRGFSPIDRISHCGPVLVLKHSPSPLSLSIWKLRTAALCFGSLVLFRLSSSPPSSPSSSSSSSSPSPHHPSPSFLFPSRLCSPSLQSIIETQRISLNYACLDLVGYDSHSSLYTLRILTDLHHSHSHTSPYPPHTSPHQPNLTRRWFTLGFPHKEDCRAWLAVLTPAVAHPLSIHYLGDSVKVRLREPVEPAVPVTRSMLQVRPRWVGGRRGGEGDVRLVAKYEGDGGEEDSDGDKLVERKAGERRGGGEEGGGGGGGRGGGEEEPHTPVAFTLLFPSLSPPLSLDIRPSPLFTPYELPPSSHLQPLLDRLYLHKVGFGCLTHTDRQLEATTHSSLLFGEVLFSGVTKLMDGVHLDGRGVGGGGGRRGGGGGGLVVVDLGSGVGKLCMQVFLQYEGVERVEGVELAYSRYGLGRQAMLELVGGEGGMGEGAAADQSRGGRLTPEGGTASRARARALNPYHLLHSSAMSTTIASSLPSTFPYPRTLTLSRGNLFHCTSALSADVVIIETLITPDSYALLSRMLERMKVGMRLLTFGDIRGLWGEAADRENVRVRREARERREGEVERGGVGGGGGVGEGGGGGGSQRGEGQGEGGRVEGEECEEGEEELPPLRFSDCPFVQLAANASKLDRFLTTWSQKKGHYFFLWRKEH